MKDSGTLPHPPAQPAPQQAPQQYVQQPPPPSCDEKSHSIPRCDENPTGHTTYPTSVGTVSQSKQSHRLYHPPHQ
jgi:hypothetical protein